MTNKSKLSVIEFLKDNGIDNLEELQTKIKGRLGNLASINPKIVSLELLHDALQASRKETSISSLLTVIDL